MSLVTQEQYELAQDPQVRPIFALRNSDGIPDVNAREALAFKLYQVGFNPDRAIWIQGLPAGAVMAVRKAYGVMWLGNAYDNQNFTPNTAMPPRAIPTKTDAADYPPFTPPTPPAPQAADDVGPKVGNIYTASYILLGPTGWKYPIGTPIMHEGQTLYFTVAGGFMPTPMWLTADQFAQWKATGTI